MRIELVYIHFPKAGGTSITTALRNRYGEALMTDYSHPPPFDWSHDPPSVDQTVRAVAGHFHANRYGKYSSAFRFTFLREPVDNLISIYHFWQTYPFDGYPAHQRFLAERPTIFEFAEYPEIQRLSSKLYFGGVDIASLAFVGFYERRRDDLSNLSARLGFPIDADLQVNTTSGEFEPTREKLKADKSAMARLANSLADDVAFYNLARERWS